jgi:hypothetical protein
MGHEWIEVDGATITDFNLELKYTCTTREDKIIVENASGPSNVLKQ